ncbi:unnamed protein product [Acanthoscelides obtectus]|uniref:Uncharacterized protein n=1 Tax=Acanthoscelides obtectus TaxID=200917 RepID=A0A9P0KNQ1_ACAOB|nr:unnamed protein product [Acanthoscelides obtectus]CAK1637730.1 hypothetical protein AOBTE_LOCUS10159 [Acanthoscelides obtectus]
MMYVCSTYRPSITTLNTNRRAIQNIILS